MRIIRRPSAATLFSAAVVVAPTSGALAFSPPTPPLTVAARSARLSPPLVGTGRRGPRCADYALCMTSRPASADGAGSAEEMGDDRSHIRRATGFSLTAMRATGRAATGLSFTALRATLRAATGVSLSTLVKGILAPFPNWFRYFLQPFLVLYYTPLMVLRYWIGPTKTARQEALQNHELFVEGWKDAIRAAEAAQEGGYWPVSVDEEGNIVAGLPPKPDLILGNVSAEGTGTQTDIAEAVFRSVEVAEGLERMRKSSSSKSDGR